MAKQLVSKKRINAAAKKLKERSPDEAAKLTKLEMREGKRVLRAHKRANVQAKLAVSGGMRLDTVEQIERELSILRYIELIHRGIKLIPTSPEDAEVIAEAEARVKESEKPFVASDSGGALEKETASLMNELTRSLKARAPKGIIREELRHKMSRGDLAVACLSADFENKLRALESILSSEDVSQMGRVEIRVLIDDILNTGVNIGIAITRANNVVGQEIEARVQRVRSKKGVESLTKKSKQMDHEIWKQMKPHVSVDKYASENIRKIRKAGIFPRVGGAGKEKESVGDDRLARIMQERLYPQKRRLNLKK